MNKIGIATNKKIIDLFNMMKDGSLVLAPSFQRKLVWNDTHKESFIETVLLGLPFPEIYLADGEINLDTQKSETLVVDGQQRLSTIYHYIIYPRDESTVESNPSFFQIENIPKFYELSKQEKTDFFDYIVVVRDLGRIEDKKIRDIFKRINSVNYALNAIEISNALYEGEFIQTAKYILEENNLFEKVSVFSESESSRMKDLEYLLLIISTIEEGGYFTSSKEVENYIKLYDNKYPEQDRMKNDISTVFELISSVNLPPDSLWNKRSSLFILVVELALLKRRSGSLPNSSLLRDTLLNLETELNRNKNEDVKKNKYAQYYYYTHQGTTGRKGRFLRGKLVREYLEAASDAVR